MTGPRLPDYLAHIVDAIDRINRYVDGLDRAGLPLAAGTEPEHRPVRRRQPAPRQPLGRPARLFRQPPVQPGTARRLGDEAAQLRIGKLRSLRHALTSSG